MSVVVIWSSSVSIARRGPAVTGARAVLGLLPGSRRPVGPARALLPRSRGARTPTTLTARQYWFPQSPGGIEEPVCNLRVDGNGIPEDADDERPPPEGGDHVHVLRLGTFQTGVSRASGSWPPLWSHQAPSSRYRAARLRWVACALMTSCTW